VPEVSLGGAAHDEEVGLPEVEDVLHVARPRFDFRRVLNYLRAGHDVLGSLAARIGAKGFHRSV
jgi:hypothetical protein